MSDIPENKAQQNPKTSSNKRKILWWFVIGFCSYWLFKLLIFKYLI